MTNYKKYLNIKYKIKDNITYEKALLLNFLYEKRKSSPEKKYLPHGWHWIYFNQNTLINDLADDGHVKRGRFLPPLKGYKRMYVGGHLLFENKIKYGSTIEKISYISSITKKKNKQTNLVFMDQNNVYKKNNKLFLTETQSLVFIKNTYLTKKKRGLLKEGLKSIIFKKKFNLDNVMLFKYSALTLNAHRIHYDIEYSKKKEGYKNLLVHGPLLATILLDQLKKINFNIISFSFKILSPIFVNEDFYLKIFSIKERKKYRACFFKRNLSNISFYCEFTTSI